MEFVSVRDLRVHTGHVWAKLKKEPELVVTSNGRPIALMTGITGKNLESVLGSIREARGRSAVSHIRKEAQLKGLDKISGREIEREIRQARRSRKKIRS